MSCRVEVRKRLCVQGGLSTEKVTGTGRLEQVQLWGAGWEENVSVREEGVAEEGNRAGARAQRLPFTGEMTLSLGIPFPDICSPPASVSMAPLPTPSLPPSQAPGVFPVTTATTHVGIEPFYFLKDAPHL